MGPVPELAFVLAPRQNLFFAELIAALSDELRALGIDVSVHEGAFPEPREGRVYAVVPPHEYFTLMHGRIGPPPDVYARTVFICAEQPGTPFFDWNVTYAAQAGAVFDINRLAVRALRDEGIDAEHLQLGWTQRWDHLRGDAERDIDVLFMGAGTPRRLEVLGSAAHAFWHRRCHFVVSDNSAPNWRASGSFLVEDEKWDLLARSKILVNVHQEDRPYFEWLRLVQAMATGCVVVSEHSLDYAPLEPGRHFLSGRPETLGHLVDHLLENGHARWEMQTAAYHKLRDELPLRGSVERLADAVRRLDQRPVPGARSSFFVQAPPTDQDVQRALDRVTRPVEDPDGAMRRVLKDVKLDLIDLRRRVDRLSRDRNGRIPDVDVVRRSRGWYAVRPRVTVLVSLYNYAEYIEGALDSLTHSRMRDWEVVVVDDGSTDESLELADRWIGRHESAAALLLRHTVNRGLGAARNTALAFARGDACFVLDADNEIYPTCFDRLLAALDADPSAAFAYGVLERFTVKGAAGLLNVFPWEPQRFARSGNYIDAMALMRTASLREVGGYRLDRRLHGWEDFDLWVRMAERGWHGTHVPDLVARYRGTDHSMLTVTNISGAEAKSIILEAAPSLMAAAGSPRS
jgi:hypothetical protein